MNHIHIWWGDMEFRKVNLKESYKEIRINDSEVVQ